MVYEQIGENVYVWRLENHEIVNIFSILKELYLTCFENKPQILTIDEINKLKQLDEIQNTSFIPHFTIVKSEDNPMPHITFKIQRVKIHWGWGMTKDSTANCQLWITKNPDNCELNISKIDYYAEKIFRILGSMIPYDAYRQIYNYTINNREYLPKLVFELNNISFMRNILGNMSLLEIEEKDIEYTKTWIKNYA